MDFDHANKQFITDIADRLFLGLGESVKVIPFSEAGRMVLWADACINRVLEDDRHTSVMAGAARENALEWQRHEMTALNVIKKQFESQTGNVAVASKAAIFLENLK